MTIYYILILIYFHFTGSQTFWWKHNPNAPNVSLLETLTKPDVNQSITRYQFLWQMELRMGTIFVSLRKHGMIYRLALRVPGCQKDRSLSSQRNLYKTSGYIVQVVEFIFHDTNFEQSMYSCGRKSIVLSIYICIFKIFDI